MEQGESSTEREHVTLDVVNEGDALLYSIRQKMESVSLSHCIARVPEELFKGSEDKYFPLSISIGPFHHGQDSLRHMEEQKWRYLNALLSRRPDAEETLDACVKCLRQLEPKARRFYGENIGMGSDQFVEMLLLDACFIIELFLVNADRNQRRRDDACFATNEGLYHLRCDLMLFENQLPFFVLDHLFHLAPIPKNCAALSITQLAVLFFKKLIPDRPHCPQENIDPPTNHLLDLIRQHYLPTSPQLLLPEESGHAFITQATRLSEVGIGIMRAVCDSPSNITFFNGILKIPSLEIQSHTEALFRNLIAMEQCQPGCSKHITSYVALMKGLIQSKRDVRMLQDEAILIDGHESEGGIVLMFKELHVDVNVKEHYYRGLCEQVRRHQRRKRDVCWVRVRDLYHRSNVGVAWFTLVVVVVVLIFTGAFIAALSFLLHHFQ